MTIVMPFFRLFRAMQILEKRAYQACLEKSLFQNLYGEKHANKQKESLAEAILRMRALNSQVFIKASMKQVVKWRKSEK